MPFRFTFRQTIVILGLLLSAALFAQEKKQSEKNLIPTENIRVRDPFILADAGTYYLYAQAKNRAGSQFQGVEVYTSTDLAQWTEPVPVLTLPESMQVYQVWAPEVHRYQDAYYLFVTLTFETPLDQPAPVSENWPPLQHRGTWCFKASSPTGPFEPTSDKPLTPESYMALDGTLWVEEGIPYLIYCHEWIQIVNGSIERIQLSGDLSKAVSEPVTILAASSAPGVIPQPNAGLVTDGPFLYKSLKSETLYLIWSTFLPDSGYSVLVNCSESGKIAGPWSEPVPLYTQNGGHAMIFTALDGSLHLVLHQPNTTPEERLYHYPILDDGKQLSLAAVPQ